MSYFLIKILFVLLIGMFIGYVYAHVKIGTECKRIGGFYVGKTVFKCVDIKKEN